MLLRALAPTLLVLPLIGAVAPADAESPPAEEAEAESQGQSVLRDNLFRQNRIFQDFQKDNYDGLLNNKRSGIKSKEAF